MRYLIANWKTHKNLTEASIWIETFLKALAVNEHLKKLLVSGELKIVMCPSYPLIVPIKQLLVHNPEISLGSQDVSTYEEGSYTGEVTARMLSGLVDYAIIGHSERRIIEGDNQTNLENKVIQAVKYGIKPIFCISRANQAIPDGVTLVAYEPVEAIGTGKNAELDSVLTMKNKLSLDSSTVYLYGGSVNKNDALAYLKSDEIGGFLAGTASFNPLDFFDLACLF